ncbi:ribonucleoside-diphosphate reductase subunit alpha [bacterium]|nr:ribonucleoside-diphosphate reductase subunit alpha [bacterium]
MTQVADYLGLKIDLDRDKDLSDQAMSLLKDYYMKDSELYAQQAFARAAVAYCEGDHAFAQRIYDYASKRWFMFASPVLSNAPSHNDKPKGLPISCFLSYVDDTLDSLISHNAEVAWLSVKGGGVGGHWSAVRPVSDKAPGVIPFMKVVDSQMTAYKQGKTRKGSYAAYLDVSHPEIIEFVRFKDPTGGDANRKCFNLFNAVNITDAFMEAVQNGEQWELRCPDSGAIRSTIQARELWQRILEARFRTGSPYLNFIDTANRGLPDSQKKCGLTIKGSNLCNEIHLATSKERTAVCCLSSVNLEKWDEWRGTRMVQDLVRLLDNVLKFFIRHAPEELEKAKYSAYMERSVGLGAMGFHGYLQSKDIAWESWQAASENYQIFKRIKEDALKSTHELGAERGECPDMAGTGRRNAHLLAIAPNANSSIICGCSASIEPIKSNAYTHRTRAGAHLVKNKDLEYTLEEHGENTETTWKSIISNEGSVQHLDFLTDHEKDVFKTAFELDQAWVVEHSAKRQEFICQGQSVNLFFPAGVEPKYPNAVHMKAWKDGLKGLYYLRTNAGVSADKVGESIARDALKDFQSQEDGEECISCQG